MTRKFLITPTTVWSDGKGNLTADAFNQIRGLFDQFGSVETSIAALESAVDDLETAVAGISTAYEWSAQQTTPSGTEKEYTAIPAGAKEVVIAFNGVSFNGSNNLNVQIGPSGGVLSSGYVANSTRTTNTTIGLVSSTSAFPLMLNSNSSAAYGMMHFLTPGGGLWICSLALSLGGNQGTVHGGGAVSVTGDLARIKMTATGGDNFDGGGFFVGWRS